MRYVAFDLETAKVIPTHVRDWHSQRPLGISCAATLDETGDLRLWYGKLPDGTPAPQMTQEEARTLLSFLEDQQFNEDRPVVTWNGAKFDFDVLGEEAGDILRAGQVARAHVDLMVAFVCVQGHWLSLSKAAEAVGSSKGGDMLASGADAPRFWAAGEFDTVLAYLEQDVRATADIARYVMNHGGFTWTSSRGRPVDFTLPRTVKRLDDMRVEQALQWPEPDTSWMSNPPDRADFLVWTQENGEHLD